MGQRTPPTKAVALVSLSGSASDRGRACLLIKQKTRRKEGVMEIDGQTSSLKPQIDVRDSETDVGIKIAKNKG